MSGQLCYGYCSSFDCHKGYGWITPNDLSADIFIHFTNINSNSTFRTLSPGQQVSYVPITVNNGKKKAVNVSIITSSKQNNTFNTNNNNQHMINNSNIINNNMNKNNFNHTNNNNNNVYSMNASFKSTYNYNYKYNTTSQNNINNVNNVLSTNHTTNNNISPTIQSHHINNNSNTSIQTMNFNSTNNESKTANDCNIETRYKWQWKDDFGKWIDFTDDISLKILSNMTNYKIGQFSYKFEINRYNQYKATQINLSTNTQRECRKMQKQFAVYEGLTLKKMLESSWNNTYPKWWFDKDTKLHDAKLVEWPLDNEICIDIIDKFNASSNQFGTTYNIQAIYSVQNKYLWKHYQFQRELHSEALGKSKLNERYLFHGTEYSATQKITVQGFLRDHGKIMAYGRGVYFALNASMSIDYAPIDNDNYQWMFLCAVILGESTCGRRSYTVPPTKPNSSVHYESMVDDVTYPKIFVISKDYQAYPLFLIKFKCENNRGIYSLLPPGLGSYLSKNNNKNKLNKKTSKTTKSLIPIKMTPKPLTSTKLKTIGKICNVNQIKSSISNSNTQLTQLLQSYPTKQTQVTSFINNTNPVAIPINRTANLSKILQLQTQILQMQKLNTKTQSIPPIYIPPPIQPINIPTTTQQPIAAMSSRYIGNLQRTQVQAQSQSQPQPQPRVYTMNNNNNNVNRNTFNTNVQSVNRMNSLPVSSAPLTLPKWAKMTAPIVDTMPNTAAHKYTNTNNQVVNGLSLSPINEGSLYVSAPQSPRCLTPNPLYLHSQPIVGSPMPPLNLLQISDVNS